MNERGFIQSSGKVWWYLESPADYHTMCKFIKVAVAVVSDGKLQLFLRPHSFIAIAVVKIVFIHHERAFFLFTAIFFTIPPVN